MSHAGEDRISTYFDIVADQLARVLASQHSAMTQVADLVVEVIEKDRIIYVFGSGHSRFIAGEMYWRAGGLAPVQTIEDPTQGAAERFEGYATTFFEQYDVQQGDLVIVISNSGINPVPIEVAEQGKKAGARVVAVTCVQHSRDTPSRHSSGKKLYELADVVLDNLGAYGDATVELKGRSWKVAPTSTAVSVTMLNAIVAQAASTLNDRGELPPVLISSNVPEGDEHNEALSERYWRRLARFPRRRAM